jgi:hypothetical protein
VKLSKTTVNAARLNAEGGGKSAATPPAPTPNQRETPQEFAERTHHHARDMEVYNNFYGDRSRAITATAS